MPTTNLAARKKTIKKGTTRPAQKKKEAKGWFGGLGGGSSPKTGVQLSPAQKAALKGSTNLSAQKRAGEKGREERCGR